MAPHTRTSSLTILSMWCSTREQQLQALEARPRAWIPCRGSSTGIIKLKAHHTRRSWSRLALAPWESNPMFSCHQITTWQTTRSDD